MQLLVIAAIVLMLDQLTKYLVQVYFQPGHSLPIFDDIFHLTYVQNPGAAFGMLKYRTGFFIFVSVVVVIAILVFYGRISPGRKFLLWGLALQLGGAVGNLIDRIRFGYVVDFLDFRVWPVFNLADSAIVIGVAMLSWELLMRGEHGAKDG